MGLAFKRATFMRKVRASISPLLALTLTISVLSAINPPVANAAAGAVTSGSCTTNVGEASTATIAQVNNDCVLTFTSGSNSWTVPANVAEADLLVIGGGGAGGTRSGGGGGAGGLVYLTNVTVSPTTTISLEVGAGGANSNTSTQGISGSDSTFSLTSPIVAKGGGGGGTGNGSSTNYAGLAGGSSGGSDGSANAPAAATQGNQNYGFGSNGALGSGVASNPAVQWTGGGGGGAGGAGTAGNTNGTGGAGGAGRIVPITGSNICYAAGGGGGNEGTSTNNPGAGGSCGGTAVGGAGSKGNTEAGSGAANTGSGGGGSGFQDPSGNGTPGNGGSGVVIVRWTIPGNEGAFPNISGMSARFNANNFNTTLNSTKGTWADTSGTGKHIAGTDITGTSITVGTTGSNANGVNKSFNVVNGTSASNIALLTTAEMTGKYTLFTVARYSGAAKERIFQAVTGSNLNYLSGFYNGMTGIHYKSAWYTVEAQPSDVNVSNWLLSSECSYDPDANTTVNSCSATYSANGMQRNHVTNTQTSAFGLGINDKGHYTNQDSDFQIADVLVFNRVLTIPEVNQVESYISGKYGLGIYSDQVVNYDPGDSSTTNKLLKNLGKGDGSLTEALDMTLYRNVLKSSENSGVLKFGLNNGSYGETARGMRPFTRFTASVWMKEYGDQSSGWNSVLTTAYDVAGQPIAPMIGTLNSNLNAGFWDGGTWRTGFANLSSSSYPVTDDVWYHVTTSYDGLNVRIYVDGVLKSTTATTASVLKYSANLRLGTRWDGGSTSFGFNGAVGKTKIYDHARSDAQILAEYNADASRYACSSTSASANGKTVVTFTTAGSCSWTAPTGVTAVRALLVGGGGGGGSWVGGGGGGGGVIDQSSVTVTPGTTYPIVVAGGGKGALTTSANAVYRASIGSNTTALGLTAKGGGSGGSWTATGTGGATGGGGSYNNTILSIDSTQGFNGGKDAYNSGYGYPTGGGGGAGAVGVTGTITTNVSGQSGAGGAGKASDITGSTVRYGGGGGGGCHNNSTYPCTAGSGGAGGGGAGATYVSNSTNTVTKGSNGSENTGGGGGGSGAPSTNTAGNDSQGGEGGSGVVVISYITAFTVTYDYNSATGGNSTTTVSFNLGDSAVTLPTPTRTSWIFGGWFLDSGFTTRVGRGGDSYSPNGVNASYTLYARWVSELMVYEPMTGTNNADMNGVASTGSSGLTGNWTKVNANKQSSVAVSATKFSTNPNFAFPKNSGFTVPTSNVAAASTGTNWTARFSARQLTDPISFDASGTYYLTYLLNASSTLSLHGTAMAGLLSGLPSSTTDSSKWALLTGYGYSGKFGIDNGVANLTNWVSNSGVSAEASSTSEPNASGSSYFVLVKFTTAASGNDTVEMKTYLPTQELPTSDSGITWDVTYSAAITGSATHLGVQFEYDGAIDEARIGYTYTSVTDARAARTVTFNSNYVGGATSTTQTIYNNIATALTNNTFTRTGYTFSGWNTNSDGTSGTAFTNGATATITSDTTLFAKWTINTQTITYAAGTGGTGSAPTSPVTVNYGSTFTVPSNTFTRTGYTFTNWSSGGVTYAPGETFPSTGSVTANVTLTANWVANACSITPTSSGGYKTYTFTNAIPCNWTVPTNVSKASVLVVGGGGGGGDSTTTATGGSGGAGGFFASSNVSISGVIEIAAGAGGAGASSSTTRGANGGNSYFGTLKVGGGGGGNSVSFAANETASPGNGGTDFVSGGSGGGGRSSGAGANNARLGGAGGTFATSGVTFLGSTYTGIAGVSGANSWSGDNASGGLGGAITESSRTSSISGSSVIYAKGGTFLPWNATNNTAKPQTYGSGGATNYNYGTAEAVGNTLGGDGAAGVVIVRHAEVVDYTYSANNGSGTAPNGGSVQGGLTFNTAANPFTRSGYTFSGWNTAANGSGTALTANSSNTMPISGSAIVLYAQWVANQYTVTYVYNSATGDTSTVTSSYTTGGTQITLPTPTRSGYTFGGWYAESTLDNLIGAGGASYAPTGSALSPYVYAKWTATNYTVTYQNTDATSGSAPTDSTNYNIGNSVLIKGNTGSLARTGYTFIGWTAASDGTGTVLTSGNTVTTSTSNMVFYPKWSANTYTITYNKNGASGNPTATSATYTTGGTAVTLTTVGDMVKTGFTFGGWSTTPTGSALVGTYTTTANVTLYAVWTIKTITLTYDKGIASGVTIANFPTTASGTYGSSVTLSAGFTLDQTLTVNSQSVIHRFVGWNDGSSTYQGTASYLLGDSNKTLTAIWVPVFGVRYSFNGGTPAATPDNLITDNECSLSGNLCNDQQDITLHAAPTRSGYTFAGWVNQSNATAMNAGSTTKITSTNYLFYATWTAQPYTVTYSTNGGSTAPTETNKYIGDSFILATAPTRDGYNFSGWSDSSTVYGAGVTYFVGAADMVFTAQWAPKTYSVSYNWNGGSGSSTSDSSFTVGNSGITLPTVGDHVKDGYEFQGWSTSSNGSVISGAFTPTNNTTLYAIWNLGNFVVTYDARGGTVGTSSATVTNGSTTVLPTPTRQNFVFEGWYTQSTGGTLVGIQGANHQPASSKTIYARWTQSSIYGIAPSALSRIGTTTARTGTTQTFSSSNAISSVSATVPAGSLPDGTTVNFDLVGDFSRAQTVLTGTNNYLVSIVVSWLAPDGTVPDTPADKKISVTITNATIKAGARIYTIVAGVANLVGTATQDGQVTVELASDPEVVVVATKPGVPRSVSATSNENKQSVISWSAPTSDGGSAITEYTVTSSGGQTCSTSSTNCTITGLTDTTTYTFTVVAKNAIGTSDSSSSVSATTAGKPGAPTSVTASSNGNQQSLVSWTAPTADGGSAISQYTVTSSSGQTCVTSSTSCSVTGLSDSTVYTFTVKATNALGDSIASSSASATTAGKPGIPGSIAATSGIREVGISWSAPVSDGGSVITGYTVTASSGATCSTASTSCTISNLTDATTYTFTVTATNALGTSSSSSTATATTSSKPDAPTSISATANGTKQSVISWNAPASDGGATISSYTVSETGGATCTTQNTTCTITGLADGTTYTFTVTATNAVGTSDPSTSTSARTADAVVTPTPSPNPTPSPVVAPVIPEPVAPVAPKISVTTVAPVTVIGDSTTKIPSIELYVPTLGSSLKPATIAIDKASEKFIASAKAIDGKLVLTPETGFSGKRTVTVNIVENGVERIVQIPLTVLPEPVAKPLTTPLAANKTSIKWEKSPNADSYAVFIDGKRACQTSATSCSVSRIIGPANVVEIVANGGDRTISEKVESDFKQTAPITVTRIVSATITKAELTRVDTKALDKVIALINNQGFETVVISGITTTKRTSALAAARIEAIKKYVSGKIGDKEVKFEVVAPTSRTYFNNISVKG